jgi:ubiquitin-large subunit ribosomal protein L40e
MVQMKIFIMAQDGNKILLEVKSSDTILSVKERIVDKQDFQVHQQNLLFGGRSLQDSMTLADYNIEDESTLDVLLRLMGD